MPTLILPRCLRSCVLFPLPQVISKAPTSFSSTTLVVSSSDDEKSLSKVRKLGYGLFTNELILTGVLRQKIELEE